MSDTPLRKTKKAKREIAAEVDSTGAKRTFIHDPKHLAYNDRSFPVHHLTRNARECLGFPPDMTALDS